MLLDVPFGNFDEDVNFSKQNFGRQRTMPMTCRFGGVSGARHRIEQDFIDHDSDNESLITGNFIKGPQIKTPGFTVNKQFTFTGIDHSDDNVQVLDDHSSSDDFSVSSMNSETFKFGKIAGL